MSASPASHRTVVGIDVYRDKIDVATDPPTKGTSFTTDAKGLRQLVASLASLDVELVNTSGTQSPGWQPKTTPTVRSLSL